MAHSQPTSSQFLVPRNNGSQSHDSNAAIGPEPQIRLPPVQFLMQEVDARRSIRISKPLSTHSREAAVCCQSTITRGLPGVPVTDFGVALPAVTLYNLQDEADLHARLTSSTPSPTFAFAWDGYNHLNWRKPVHVRREVMGTIHHFICQVMAQCYLFAQENADKFRGPGVRLGPNHVPFENLRLQRIVQSEGNVWIAIFALFPTPKQRYTRAQ
ncbi:hypothetical protein FPV67DRAFT_1447947 [Lyophyllum atratum]|nr:hypothetical protein FPV67DRAFT_1447947 [Lyophyllum atratum]